MEMRETRNLILAIALSLLVFWGWDYFFGKKPSQESTPTATQSTTGAPVPGVAPQTAQILTRNQAVAEQKRIEINSPTLKGSIALKGTRVDDLTLKNYRETTAKDSPLVNLLSPAQTEHPYYAEFGWVSPTSNVPTPKNDTSWSVEGNAVLTPETPVVLKWDNGQGVTFERTISIDKEYMIGIKDKVTNNTAQAVEMNAYGAIVRENVPQTSSFFILHEGPIGYLNNELVELKYDELQKTPLKTYNSQGGWLGITDKYWLTALIPDQYIKLVANYRESPVGSTQRYQADFSGPVISVAPGQSIEMTNHLFAGAKILEMLDNYETVLNIKHFDLAVDFGWFYFLTKPIFYILTTAKAWLGNFGLAILFLTVILKLIFFPLANKSYRSMARMKELQPKITALRERYSDDKLKMNQEVMELYKREKINPMAGCLPMLIQIPVFFALYKVLFVTIEMRQAPFYGWIHDLSAPDPTSLFNLFGLIPWTPPSFLMIGAWPLIMGGTMLLQQKISPPPADPIQARMFMLMPVIFTVMLAQFPAGLVIYWAWNNILTIAQQWTIMQLEKKHKASAA
jgi:YidC/Oxa1 family membrane protein insertase